MQQKGPPKGPFRGDMRLALWLAGAMLSTLAALALASEIAIRLQVPPMGAAALGQAGLLLVFLLFTWADGHGFKALGIPGMWKNYDPGVIVGLILLQIAGSTLTALLLQQLQLLKPEEMPVTQLFQAFSAYDLLPFTLFAFLLALMAGVGEELLFRSYLITRLERLGLGAWPTILLSALIFGLIHWPGYGLLPALSKALWFGVPTGAFFWYRRSLGPLVAAHTLLDFFGFMMAYVAARVGAGLTGM